MRTTHVLSGGAIPFPPTPHFSNALLMGNYQIKACLYINRFLYAELDTYIIFANASIFVPARIRAHLGVTIALVPVGLVAVLHVIVVGVGVVGVVGVLGVVGAAVLDIATFAFEGC